jgi:sodium/potassium-transporting ATPase subunit alpha
VTGEEHKLPLAELYRQLNSGPNGLTGQEATLRLRRYGPNELRARRTTPEILKFLGQFTNFFALLLLVGASLALLAEHLAPGEGNLYIASAIAAVVVLNAVFSYVQGRASERIMESFKKLLPLRIDVLRDGKTRRIEAKELVPGDVFLLYEGDRVPADARLIEQNQLKIDLSGLTGESEPQLRHLECTHENLLESRNMVFSGALVQSGDGRALVYGTGMDTQIGRIVTLTKEAEEVETPLRREIKHFIRVISIIAVALGVFFFAVSLAIGKTWLAALLFAIGIIVANVPEGLLPTVTLALAMASKRMARKKALIKNLDSVETLGSTTVICTDKTGTLTQNRLRVTTLLLNGREFGAGDRRLLDQPSLTQAWEIMTLCNNARLSDQGKWVAGDPTEGALLMYANKLAPVGRLIEMGRLHERPFDSNTRRMITVHPRVGNQGFLVCLKGAPEVVLGMCSRASLRGRCVRLPALLRRRVEEAYQRLARRAERVLALAYKEVEDEDFSEDNFILVGLVGLRDPLRPEAEPAIEQCRSAGIRVIMITGDHRLTAEAVARETGLFQNQGRIVLGDELEAMGDEALTGLLDAPELVFARTSPAQKLRIVKALQAKGEIVTVTGDGVNDAPALKNADMGVAMGIMGTEAAREASDMVLLDDNFATIVSAIQEGRTIFGNIRKFIAYILTSNVPELFPFIAYAMLAIPLPLTIVLILAIDVGTDMLPAIALGSEPPESDTLRRPPRPRHERLLTANLLRMSYGVIGVIQAAAGFCGYFLALHLGGWQWGGKLASTDPLYRTAVTAFFASVIICQIANVMICRTQRQSVFRVGLFSNKLVILGILTELAFLGLISYMPALNAVFGTAPLAPWHYLPGVGFAVLILFGDEFRKWLARRGNAWVTRWLMW